MKLTYEYAESNVCPATIEMCKTTVYLRKDIKEEKRTCSDGSTVTMYVYQEAKLSRQEFLIHADELSRINAVKGVNDSDNIAQIVMNGSDSSNNQLILMEAIADLYDLIATMM